QRTWESHHVGIVPLRPDHPNMAFTYRIRVPVQLASQQPQFVDDVRALVESCPKELWLGAEPLTAAVQFGEHTYQPLLLDPSLPANVGVPYRAAQEMLAISPPVLNASEQHFIEQVKQYWN